MTTEASWMTRGKGPRVVVVGPCASGKTTLVENLKSVGVDARVSGQEHSAIRNLWQRLEPDVLIALDLDLETLRERRYPTWSAGLYDVQHRRLEEAFEAADVTIDTSETPEEDVLEVALAVIAHYRARACLTNH
jgi:GTPase SAR1 family protein